MPVTQSPTLEAPRQPIAQFGQSGKIRIGRAPDNDIVINDLWVSLHHAELRRTGTDYIIVDLGSANGIYKNGRRVSSYAPIRADDQFSIGRHDFSFDGTRVFDHDDQGPTSIVARKIAVVVKNAQLLDDVNFALQQGNLLGIIGPSGCGKSTLLKAMTGIRPATRGSLEYDGKNLYKHYSELRHRIGLVPQDDVLHLQLTVRRALRFAASLRFAGDVSGRDRRKRVEEVIDTLGLTQRAKQRITSLSGGQRKRTSVALELLTEPSLLALDEPTSGLDPALDKEIMVELKAIANRGRTVVVVTHSVLHLGMCDRVLVMCLGGRVGYFGPPDGVLAFFEAEDYAEVFDKITNAPEEWALRYSTSEIYRKYVVEVLLDLEQRKRQDKKMVATAAPDAIPEAVPDAVPAVVASPSAAATVVVEPVDVAEPPTVTNLAAPTAAAATPAAVAAPAAAVVAAATAPAASAAEPQRPVFADSTTEARPKSTGRRGVQERSLTQQVLHPMDTVRQFFTLSLRMAAVMFSDLGSVALLLGLPIGLGLLSWAVPGTATTTGTTSLGLGADQAFPLGGSGLEGQRLLTVLVIGAAFMGVAIAIREIINEASIYKRERAIGLSPTAYLLSKVFVFIILDIAQAFIFVYMTLLRRPGPAQALVLPDGKLEIVATVALTGIASTALALLVSALVSTPEQTTPILVISVMFQLVLSGSLFAIPAGSPLNYVSWIDPARWGFAAGASTIDLNNNGFTVLGLDDSLWLHTADNWTKVMVVMVVQTIILLVAARIALTRYEPGKG